MSVLYLVALLGVGAILLAVMIDAVASVARQPVWSKGPTAYLSGQMIAKEGQRPSTPPEAHRQREEEGAEAAQFAPARLDARRRATQVTAASPASISAISLGSGTAATLSMPSR